MSLAFRRAMTAAGQGSFFIGCSTMDVAELCVGVCIMMKVRQPLDQCM
jgi:hypothetical protein